ncbi:low molecular weight phosphatase family protein [Effusibacillus dendaii]|uniref:Phosphotyrosine protein phosphatase I domain-containing protein n=1 Tax=Effusibacillus dendaii TaxID=2743772 RepID=A0A7I8D892_9BACL|nr:hypothetical protein [Effusibacillus dendaii]BCJ86334.1 hypothetical protein skT53_13190 [Effusibacillus dendaii]
MKKPVRPNCRSLCKNFIHENFRRFASYREIVRASKRKMPDYFIPFGTRQEEWNIQDPINDSESRMEDFRKTRDEIQKRVKELLYDLQIPVISQL